jgi:hypothetical protein
MEKNQWQLNKKNPDIAQSLDRVTHQFLSTRSQTFKLTHKKKVKLSTGF